VVVTEEDEENVMEWSVKELKNIEMRRLAMQWGGRGTPTQYGSLERGWCGTRLYRYG